MGRQQRRKAAAMSCLICFASKDRAVLASDELATISSLEGEVETRSSGGGKIERGGAWWSH
jgi:hypothetical protein